MGKNWNQPVCVPCWNNKNPDRPTTSGRVQGPREECCFCGSETHDGIYVRQDPALVPFPTA